MVIDHILAQIRADLVEQIERDFDAQLVWGKRWHECTPHEQSEVMRLRATPSGGGFAPRAEGAPEPFDTTPAE